MFVRSKDPEGNNVTIVASQIVGMVEFMATKVVEPAAPVEGQEAPAPVEPEEIKLTQIMTSSASFTVTDTERAIRSKMLKAFASADSAEEA